MLLLSSDIFKRDKNHLEEVMTTGESDGYVIRVRGLPWSSAAEEVLRFFSGTSIVKDNISGPKAKE